MNTVITVGIAAAGIAQSMDVLVSYALGSCVGVCLYEQQHHIGGMVHILLPYKAAFPENGNVYKFADSGITALLNGMLCKGADRRYITAKIAGGAEMFQDILSTSIGKHNVAAVKETLYKLHIPIAAEHTGSNYGRTIWLHCNDGSLKIKTVNNGFIII